MKKILVTGGAGFIGSFLVDALVERGHTVRILDNLEEQVHHGTAPKYLNAKAEFVQGDVRELETVRAAMQGINTVIHCASAVGVGQSQYEIEKYVNVNAGGMANVLQCVIAEGSTVNQVLLPTSMTSYGEGAYRCADHGVQRPGLRPMEQVERGQWEPLCHECKKPMLPVPTDEKQFRESASIYALSKNIQEDMLMNISRTYGFAATALRLFNVYGPRQSLSNPYTGVTAIFLSRLKNDQEPVVYEDGLQTRDFISVHDVVDAFLLAMDHPKANGEIFNVGSGKGTTIRDIGTTLAKLLGKPIEPLVKNEARKNDVRHCIADNTKLKTLLGWTPKVTFEEGMKELIAWGEHEEAVDRFAEAEAELKAKGIAK